MSPQVRPEICRNLPWRLSDSAAGLGSFDLRVSEKVGAGGTADGLKDKFKCCYPCIEPANRRFPLPVFLNR